MTIEPSQTESHEPIQQPKQIYRVVIEADIHTVWEILTREGEPLPFFFDAVLHTTGLAPGAPIRMRTKNGKFTGVVGEVLAIDPPHLYSHTFKFTGLDDSPCTVTYELKEMDGGTQFTLITENVPTGTKSEKYMAQGGEFITRTLKHLAETGRVPLKSRCVLLMCHLTEWMNPARMRSENWPLE